MESEASEIFIYESQSIIGRCRSAPTPASCCKAGASLIGKPELDKKVRLRLSCQRILSRATPPPAELDVVLHEATLHRVIGSDRIMADQLDHLLAMSEQPQHQPARTTLPACPHTGREGPPNKPAGHEYITN